MLVEDADRSRLPVRDSSPHFDVFEEFKEASYLQKYDLLCQKLTKEQLYTTASILVSPGDALNSGDYSQMSSMTGIKTFVSSLAGHIAAEAARLG